MKIHKNNAKVYVNQEEKIELGGSTLTLVAVLCHKVILFIFYLYILSFDVSQGHTFLRGHYTSLAKRGEQWYHFDDYNVSQVNVEEFRFD